jgi:choline transport protein
VATTCFICGLLIQGLLILNYPTYIPQRWHGTLLFWAVLCFGLVINTWLGRHLPRIEALMLFLYVMGFFGVLIPLIYLSPHKSASDVFTVFQNLGGWNTTTLSFFVGFVTVMGSFLGMYILGVWDIASSNHIGSQVSMVATILRKKSKMHPRSFQWP